MVYPYKPLIKLEPYLTVYYIARAMNFSQHFAILKIDKRFYSMKPFCNAVLLFFILLSSMELAACSMYKITKHGCTLVGCNQDAWRTTTNIWFENARDDIKYGVCYTGSRKIGDRSYAPQSGMNDQGLVFSRLTSYYPKKDSHVSNKKKVTNEVQYLKSVLQKCKSTEEVENFINRFDHSYFLEDVFIYVDKQGRYLVVEPYKLIAGNEENYILGNFCPSITSNQNARRQTRYKNGQDFLDSKNTDTSLNYCRTLSDTMSVCRERHGDGTLLTSIWNTQEGKVNLYFYHNFDSTVQFDIQEELSKGDHMISIPEIFPSNHEFQNFLELATPFSRPYIRIILVFLGGVLLASSFLFLYPVFMQKKPKLRKYYLILSIINLLLFFYLIVLSTDINIFFFDAPYQHPSNIFISLLSYLPVLLAICLIPICLFSLKMLKQIKGVFPFLGMANTLVYIVLVLAFGYWGFLDIL